MTLRSALLLVAALGLLPAAGPAAARAAADATGPVPLAVVGPDTVTTHDLQLELNVMLRTLAKGPDVPKPAPDTVLKRLIQNQLLVQEGYRMEVDRRFSVRNQVRDIVREKAMAALLDSVADAAPVAGSDTLQARRDAVDDFIDGLWRSYDVQVDSTLLASLDYGSQDKAVYDELRASDAVLASMRGRTLRVHGLTQTIRWEEFHGLGGRSDAAEVRDEIFGKWVDETLVMMEAYARGFQDRPEIVEAAQAVERALVHEETFRALIDLDYVPDDDEVRAYYEEHLDEFTPAPRIKLQSVMINGEEPARQFCERLRQGAKLSWLAKRTPEVVEGPPPFPAEWHAPENLGVDPADARVGFVPEPYEVPGGGWVAAVVAGVQESEPLPLEECRRQVVTLLKSERLRASVVDVVSRLEAAADIRILPGAEETVARHLDAAYASLEAE